MKIYRSLKRFILAAISILVAFSIGISHVTGQDMPFYWEFINVNIDVQTNGDMLVTETQKYVFTAPHTNERYRYIKLDKVDEIREITVEENGQNIPIQPKIENNQVWIRWKHELNPPENHTFVLKYRVVGGLHITPGNTQVYWKAIFADRKAPVQNAKVTVQLPESLSGKVLSFTNFGVSAIAKQVNDRTFEFVAQRSLQPGEELEVQIVFPNQILTLPPPKWQQQNTLSDSLLGELGKLIPFSMFLFLFFLFGLCTLKIVSFLGTSNLQLQKQNLGSKIIFFFLFLLNLLFFLPFLVVSFISTLFSFPSPITIICLLAIVAIIHLIRIRCPQCNQFKLKRTSEVLVHPTTNMEGKKRVIHHCHNCSYHKEYEKIIRSYSEGGGG